MYIRCVAKRFTDRLQVTMLPPVGFLYGQRGRAVCSRCEFHGAHLRALLSTGIGIIVAPD